MPVDHRTIDAIHKAFDDQVSTLFGEFYDALWETPLDNVEETANLVTKAGHRLAFAAHVRDQLLAHMRTRS